MGCKGEKEEIDTACCSTHLHKIGKIFPIRQSYPQSNALKKVVDGKSEDDEEATSGCLDAFLHWDRNVVAVAVRITLARDVPSPDQSPMAKLFHQVDENESGEHKYFCHRQVGVS